jgi:release factor glutamine methyltransferase
VKEPTLGEAIAAARGHIGPREASVLLSHLIGRDPAYIIAHPELPLRSDEAQRFTALVDRRTAGEPVAYLTGEREFYGRRFSVSPSVLIPRPETELLVDLAIERISAADAARVLDLGTGSGCVAISIASERSRSKVLAVDQSLAALTVARANALALRVGNVAFLQSNWFDALGAERFDLIVSNPPYIAESDPHLTRGDLRYEPRSALQAGVDGLDSIRWIVEHARRYLAGGGWLLFEHGHDQAQTARALLKGAGYADVFSACDLAGIERVSGGRLTLAGASR